MKITISGWLNIKNIGANKISRDSRIVTNSMKLNFAEDSKNCETLKI